MPEESPFPDHTGPIARVQVSIPLPSTDAILEILHQQIPQVLKADVHAQITKLYAQGTFDSLVEQYAKELFVKWLTGAGPDGRSQEEIIIARFHHFMTEQVAGPRTRQDYLVKVILTAFPDLAKKLAEAQPAPTYVQFGPTPERFHRESTKPDQPSSET